MRASILSDDASSLVFVWYVAKYASFVHGVCFYGIHVSSSSSYGVFRTANVNVEVLICLCGVVSLILLFAIEYINSVHMRWLDTGRRYLRRIVL